MNKQGEEEIQTYLTVLVGGWTRAARTPLCNKTSLGVCLTVGNCGNELSIAHT